MLVSIVVPALNEETAIGPLLARLRRLSGEFEVIVVDGGSTDGTAEAVQRSGCTLLACERGRGRQQAAGARHARGEAFWFLHADSVPPADAVERIVEALRDPAVAGGNFRLCFDGELRSARQLTAIYPWLRMLGLCYGDSGIFVRRSVYEAAGGFQPFALFEDVDLVRRIRRHGRFRTLEAQLKTSSRRFENRNFALMFAHWTLLQTLYWAGVHPNRLARWYAPVRQGGRASR